MQMPCLDAALDRETTRLAALTACRILHTPRERSFDSLVFTAAQLFRAPIALINFVHADYVWAKAGVGVVGSTWDRHDTFCSAAIETGATLIVEDAALDPRFANLPIVTSWPYMRFYAGVPIHGPEQHVIGTLCIMDRSPRMLFEHKRKKLKELAKEAESLLRGHVSNMRFSDNKHQKC